MAFVRRDAKSVRLFSIDIPDLGDVTFSVDFVATNNSNAKNPVSAIYADYCASFPIREDDTRSPSEYVKIFGNALVILSFLFRQAITLHGWTQMRSGLRESHWINPLSLNSTPSDRVEHEDSVVSIDELEKLSQDMLRVYLNEDNKLRKLVEHLSVAVSPHIEQQTPDAFTFMFSAFEKVVDFEYRKNKNKAKNAADCILVDYLERMREEIRGTDEDEKLEVIKRVDGFIQSVKNGRPSFGLKLSALLQAYPVLDAYTSDLWPVEGAGKLPGLKEIRNKLAHESGAAINHQSLAVAAWHLSVLIERLICVLLNVQLPRNISPQSHMLCRNNWYKRVYWEKLRCETNKSS